MRLHREHWIAEIALAPILLPTDGVQDGLRNRCRERQSAVKTVLMQRKHSWRCLSSRPGGRRLLDRPCACSNVSLARQNHSMHSCPLVDILQRKQPLKAAKRGVVMSCDDWCWGAGREFCQVLQLLTCQENGGRYCCKLVLPQMPRKMPCRYFHKVKR